MSGVNKTITLGRLGNDPEMRYTADGKAIANLSVATSEEWKDKNTGEKKKKTEWHRIVAFGRLAEIMAEYLKKGSQIYIEGRLQTREWTDKNEIKRYTTEIVATMMQMLDSKSTNQPADRAKPPSHRMIAKHNVNFDVDNKDVDKDIPF